MLPTTPPPRSAIATSSGPYLELENQLRFKRDEYAIAIDTVLYSRPAEPDRPKGLLDRLLSPLKSALGAVRAWRAKNWVVNYVESNFGGATEAKDFLRSVRAQGKVDREDFLCLLLSDKVNSLTASRVSKSTSHAGDSLDAANRNAVLERLIKQELSKEGFDTEQANAFTGFMQLGQLNEPDAKLLRGFVKKFQEKLKTGQCGRVMHLLKPKVDDLAQSLAMLKKQIKIRGRKDESIGVVVDFSLKTAIIRPQIREALADSLAQAWEKEKDTGMADLPLVIKRRNVFLRYLRTGLTGMSDQDFYHLKWFAKAAKHQTEYTFPDAWRINEGLELGEQFDAALAEIGRMEAKASQKSRTELLKDALANILLAGHFNAKQRMYWNDAIKPLLDFARDGTLPPDGAARQALRQLIDTDIDVFTVLRDAAILESAELSQLYEVISSLRIAFRDNSTQPLVASGQQPASL